MATAVVETNEQEFSITDEELEQLLKQLETLEESARPKGCQQPP